LCYHSIWATFSRSVLDGDRVTRVSGSYGGGEKATKRSSILVKPRMSSYETNKACISLSEQYCAVHCRTWKYLAPKYCVPSHIISEANGNCRWASEGQEGGRCLLPVAPAMAASPSAPPSPLAAVGMCRSPSLARDESFIS
jgi:hypothetical protein